MCVAVCGGVGGGGEAGAKTASLLSGEERRKCEDTQSWGRGGGGGTSVGSAASECGRVGVACEY